MPVRSQKPRGRPPKGLLEVRARSVTVRFSAGEAAQLELFAREAGLTASEFIRARTLSNRPAPAIGAELKHDLCRLLLTVQRGLRDDLPKRILGERMQAMIDRLQQ